LESSLKEITMADAYATIADADETLQEQLADVLDLRAADPQQRAMLMDYLAELPLAAPARVLEIGCGTGWVARAIAAANPGAEVVGIDPSPVFIDRARCHAGDDPRLEFTLADGRELPFDDACFDAVVCHTSLCHIPGPEQVLSEAARVARANAWLAVFDGDYATTTVAIAEADPLQACVDAAIAALVHDRFLVRRLTTLVRDAGWTDLRVKSHGYAETAEPGYMLTLIDRGADLLASSGRLAAAAAAALKEEARHRCKLGTFFGHIAYASLLAHRHPDA
jgi:ubiquinone/menaquinone biosynthesis C-methylase UbiE